MRGSWCHRGWMPGGQGLGACKQVAAGLGLARGLQESFKGRQEALGGDAGIREALQWAIPGWFSNLTRLWGLLWDLLQCLNIILILQ